MEGGGYQAAKHGDQAALTFTSIVARQFSKISEQ
jgi:hypothetical protein